MVICGNRVPTMQRNMVIRIKRYHLFSAFYAWQIMLEPTQDPLILAILM